mgnify:CR=1 FL=1
MKKKFFPFLMTLWCNATLIFFILRLIPGDPAELMLGGNAREEEVVKLRGDLLLDRPLYEQYALFMKNLVTANLGDSFIQKKPVLLLVQKAFYPTCIISFISVFMAYIIGIFLGVWAAIKKDTPIDYLLRFCSMVILTIPIFSFALLLILLFSLQLHLLPVSELSTLRHYILPVMTLAIPLGMVLMRFVRVRFLEEETMPFVQVHRAKGSEGFHLYRKILKVILSSVNNITALQLSVVLTGTLVTESIFDIPGVGRLMFDAIAARDYPVVQGVTIYMSIVYLFVFFLFDFLNGFIDPRWRSIEA